MSRRHKIGRKSSAKMFTRNAMRVHPMNGGVRSGPMRGGIRL